jgi:hypothetical protein
MRWNQYGLDPIDYCIARFSWWLAPGLIYHSYRTREGWYWLTIPLFCWASHIVPMRVTVSIWNWLFHKNRRMISEIVE